MIARPSLPARAVRPIRCKCSSALNGGSYSTTRSTLGRSRPRDATSVQRRKDGVLEFAKACIVPVRIFWGREPCRRKAVIVSEVDTIDAGAEVVTSGVLSGAMLRADWWRFFVVA